MLDPVCELGHELHGGRGVAIDELSAQAVIKARNYIETTEGLNGLA